MNNDSLLNLKKIEMNSCFFICLYVSRLLWFVIKIDGDGYVMIIIINFKGMRSMR
jgi:hypothetical protein